MHRIQTFLFAFALGLAFQTVVAEEPVAEPAPEAPADTWKEGIVQEFPTQYEQYIPGYEQGPSESLEVEAGPVDTTPDTEPATNPGSSDSDSDSSWTEMFADRNVINILLLAGIVLLFVIYQIRSGGKRRG
ncbi:MAG TPA: hypothetical protein DEA96_17040 [Leptospiraceae bacterium]|mgnify:CR=1 FL=1|nr:hypothetical protein [Spirochaetaceae bacterium]HBS06677.1 hypothetical protein [Leptospiraceae bacterium]|tara:strand:+ start:170608 stop:171000 length:393 start_codon:yes stop_codon:yes gene_type:complete